MIPTAQETRKAQEDQVSSTATQLVCGKFARAIKEAACGSHMLHVVVKLEDSPGMGHVAAKVCTILRSKGYDVELRMDRQSWCFRVDWVCRNLTT
jgi:hypothetical protein